MMGDRSEGSVMLMSEREQPAPKLAVEHLVKTRRSTSGETVTAVDDVTFEVHQGEFVCLLGPSGCGKTTILNILAGLDQPTTGAALLDGEPIPGPGPDRAVLFQEPALFPWLSVVANVEFALKHVGVAPGERRTRDWLVHRGHYDRFFRRRDFAALFGGWGDVLAIREERNGLAGFYHVAMRRKHA